MKSPIAAMMPMTNSITQGLAQICAAEHQDYAGEQFAPQNGQLRFKNVQAVKTWLGKESDSILDAPEWQPVAIELQNDRGISGPDCAWVKLRDGRVIEIGDDGLNVFRSLADFLNGHEPEHSLTFSHPCPPSVSSVKSVVKNS